MNNRTKGSKTGVDTYILELDKHTQITIPTMNSQARLYHF